MCGRTRCCFSASSIANTTNVPRDRWSSGDKYQPKNNMTPGMDFPILYQDNTHQRCLHVMKWGLIPAYTKKGEKLDYFKMFNARSETVESKLTFRKLIHSQRCVIILNGYYEWKLIQGMKLPYYVTTKSQTPLQIAGIYDIFQDDSDSEPIYSFAMLTCPANDSISWLHERQPLFLTNDQVSEWIDLSLPPNASIVHRAGGSHQNQEDEVVQDEAEEDEIQDESKEDRDDPTSSYSSFHTRHLSYLPNDIISYTVTPNMTSPTYQEADSCTPYTPRLSHTISSFFQKKTHCDVEEKCSVENKQDRRRKLEEINEENNENKKNDDEDNDTRDERNNEDNEQSQQRLTKKRTKGQGSMRDYFQKKK